MKITKYGLPQAAAYPGFTALVMIICGAIAGFHLWILSFEIPLFIVLIWMLSFFRDPVRKIVYDDSVLYSPCDGTVTETSNDGGLKISMFLSLFNVHINRAPCSGVVDHVSYKKGEFRDARDPLSAQVNESNELSIKMSAYPYRTVVVRQVSGAVARHIICPVKAGDALRQGEKFGMIKFGSRTELIVPEGINCSILVKPGDKVKAGITPLLKAI